MPKVHDWKEGSALRIGAYCFNEATRAALLKSAWWEWPETEIRNVVSLLCSSDATPFLTYVRHREPSSENT